MAYTYGKLNFSTAFNPTSAFPLDARSLFDSYADALAAARTAEGAGSSTTTYYFGEQMAVVAAGVATLYIIEKETCDASVDSRGYRGTLKEVGSKTLGDSESIDLDTDSGELSIHDFGTATDGQVLMASVSGTGDDETREAVWGSANAIGVKNGDNETAFDSGKTVNLVAGNNVTLTPNTTDNTITVNASITASDLGLDSAMHFIGTEVAPADSANALTDGATGITVSISGATGSYTPAAGDVVLGSNGKKEYIYTATGTWEEFGNEGNYKVTQTAVAVPTTATANAVNANVDVVTNLTQNANGDISYTLTTLPLASYKTKQEAVASPDADANLKTAAAIDTISQDANGVITATKKDIQITVDQVTGLSTSLAGYKPLQTSVSAPTSTIGTTTSFVDAISQDENGAISYTAKTVDFSAYPLKADLSTTETMAKLDDNSHLGIYKAISQTDGKIAVNSASSNLLEITAANIGLSSESSFYDTDDVTNNNVNTVLNTVKTSLTSLNTAISSVSSTVGDLSATETIASIDDDTNVVTLYKGITQTAGVIDIATTDNSIDLAAVAKTGAASNVSIATSSSLYNATTTTNVDQALEALNSSKVAANADISAGTATKITYDAKGLVTAGESATASDIVRSSTTAISATTVEGALTEIASDLSSYKTVIGTPTNIAEATLSAQVEANTGAISTLQNQITSVFHYKGTAAGYGATGAAGKPYLTASGDNTATTAVTETINDVETNVYVINGAVGDVYVIGDKEYVCINSTTNTWEMLGFTTDLSGYATTASVAASFSTVSTSISTLDAEVVKTVQVNGTALSMTSNTVNIPAGTSDTLGAVKVDNSTIQASEGAISVKAVSTDLLTQGTDTLIFNCGTATS